VARHDPQLRLEFAWHPHGLPVEVPVAGAHAAGESPAWPPSSPDELELLQDVEARQLFAMARTEREAWARERRLEARLDEFARRERDVAAALRRAGYLHAP
jgi:hypothetical protein